jgi:hypothetical protein
MLLENDFQGSVTNLGSFVSNEKPHRESDEAIL